MKVIIKAKKPQLKIGTTYTRDFIANDYRELDNKPKINDVELIGNKTLEELDIQPKGDYLAETLTNLEIEEIFKRLIRG